MLKVQYRSVLTGQWVDSHLEYFSSERRAANAAARELKDQEIRVISLSTCENRGKRGLCQLPDAHCCHPTCEPASLEKEPQ